MTAVTGVTVPSQPLAFIRRPAYCRPTFWRSMMNALKRTGLIAALAALSAAPRMAAQVPGMPLFTNPRFATGFRIHADYGMPTQKDPSGADLSVIQGGLGF